MIFKCELLIQEIINTRTCMGIYLSLDLYVLTCKAKNVYHYQ